MLAPVALFSPKYGPGCPSIPTGGSRRGLLAGSRVDVSLVWGYISMSYMPGPAPSRSLIDSVADTTSHRDRDSLNGAVARLLFDFLPATVVTVYRMVDEQDARSLQSVAHEPHSASSEYPTPEPPGWADCLSRRESTRYMTPEGEFIYLFPVESSRNVVGLMMIHARSELQDKQIGFVESILRILRNHVELLEYGERDTLTHLLNRKTFDSRFDKLRHLLQDNRDGRARQQSWIAMLDIDQFKSINDAYGHLFGDEVLLLLAQLMQQCFRGADQLFRFGGEEFLIVLDDATDVGAKIAYERMREAAASFDFPQVGRVTVSIGYSQIGEADSPASCTERADAALYYAKHHGRNLVCHFEALEASGELRAKAADGGTELF